jgi:hypothetical protein
VCWVFLDNNDLLEVPLTKQMFGLRKHLLYCRRQGCLLVCNYCGRLSTVLRPQDPVPEGLEGSVVPSGRLVAHEDTLPL